MSLGEHLVEFRKRLIISAVAIIVAGGVGFYFASTVLEAIEAPITRIAEETARTTNLNYSYVTEAFDVRLQIAITLALVIASPVWLHQIWAYIVPALKRQEKRYAVGFLLTAIPLFLAGCVMGWLLFPNMVALLASFSAEGYSSLFRAKDYVDFVTKLVIAVGIGFVLPVFLVLLNFIGVISARSIIKGWRVAIVTIALFTALATPPADVVSMVLLSIPMILLYFIAAGVAWLHDRAAARRADKFATELAT